GGGGRRLVADPGRAPGDGLPGAADEPGRRTARDGEFGARGGSPRRACVRLLPPQQAPGVGGQPRPGHSVRDRQLSGAVTMASPSMPGPAGREPAGRIPAGRSPTGGRPAASARSRSTVPSPGRLGLVESTAPDDLDTLGWAKGADVSTLWALSRAPDSDLALRTLVRMKESLDEADRAAAGDSA